MVYTLFDFSVEWRYPMRVNGVFSDLTRVTIGWSVGQLGGRLVGALVGPSVRRSARWSVGRSVGQFVELSVSWLVGV